MVAARHLTSQVTCQNDNKLFSPLHRDNHLWLCQSYRSAHDLRYVCHHISKQMLNTNITSTTLPSKHPCITPFSRRSWRHTKTTARCASKHTPAIPQIVTSRLSEMTKRDTVMGHHSELTSPCNRDSSPKGASSNQAW